MSPIMEHNFANTNTSNSRYQYSKRLDVAFYMYVLFFNSEEISYKPPDYA